jgi:hypothetical protein
MFDLSPEIAFGVGAATADAAVSEPQHVATADALAPTVLAKSSLFDSGASNSSSGASVAAAEATPHTGFRSGGFVADSATPGVNPMPACRRPGRACRRSG